MTTLSAWLADRDRVRRRRGIVRETRAIRHPPGWVDLASNDYLGLADDPRLIAAAVGATRRHGTGARASRVVTGTLPVHDELEAELCELTGRRAALAFSSGYLANLGVLTALAGAHSEILLDAHVHASLHDAAVLSRARVRRAEHGDVAALDAALAESTAARKLVVVESVYSVLGDAAPLAELAGVCDRHDAVLVVDEAHAIGVVGDGRGAVAAAGLADAEHVVQTGTLSKALGAQGGVVLGSESLREHLVNAARTFVYDTGLAPAPAAAAAAACRIVASEPERRARLRRNARVIAEECGTVPAAGAVQSIPVPSAAEAARVAERLAERDVRVGCFRPPSVPDGISRIRLTANAAIPETRLREACTHVREAIGGVRAESGPDESEVGV